MTESVTYVAGGTVQAGGGIYISRQADQELLELCRASKFGYVLTPRQMGKSSLMVRTSESLQQENIRTVIVDLTKMGTQATPDAWYLGLLTIICRQLKLMPRLVKWWQDNQYLGVTQRLTQFFEEVVLTQVSERIVIFVDEIDTTLNLDFTDDFFIAIRYFYLARAENSEFERLSFVLIGVASPSDLIRDPQRTPFNIGDRVDLTDFTLREALPLAAGLDDSQGAGRQVLAWVLGWTGGHPYLTQRLCSALTEANQSSWSEWDVETVVKRIFLGEASRQDTNLQFVRDMLTRRSPDLSAGLTIYMEVLKNRQVLDEEQSLIKSHLKLSGVVKRNDRRLQVRNPIYQKVFGTAWVREHLPVNWVKRLRRAAVFMGTVFLIVTAPLGVAAGYLWLQAEQRSKELEQANSELELKSSELEQANSELEQANANTERQRDLARRSEAEAKAARDEANERRSVAEEAKEVAERAQNAEAKQREEAEQARREEFKQRQIAEIERDLAEEARRETEVLRDVALLRETSTQGLIRLSSPRAVEGLVLAMYSEAKSRELPEEIIENSDIRTVVESSLLQASEEAKEQMVLSGAHEGFPVLSVALSPDSQRIVSAGQDQTVRLWDMQGNPLETLSEHESEVVSVAFIDNGSQIISVDRNGVVKRWQSDGSPIDSLEGETSSAISSISTNAETIAATLFNGAVAIRDLSSDQWTEWFVNPSLVQEVPERLQEGDRVIETSTQLQNIHSFEGRAGQEILIRMESEQFDTYLILQNAAGGRIAERNAGGDGINAWLRTVLPESERYNVVATSADGTANGAYDIRIDEIQLNNPPIVQAPAAQLEADDPIDDYQFEGQAGQVISISMESEDFDTFLILQNAAGESIVENNDRGDGTDNSLITTVLPEDGIYTILATLSEGVGSGAYLLEAREIPSSPILQEEATRLEETTLYQYGDSYPIEGQGGQALSISMESEDFDTVLQLQNAAGEAITENDDRGDGTLNSSIITVLPEAGIYTVVATSLSPARGTYNFLINPQPVNSVDVSPNGRQIITTSLEGTLQLRDLESNPVGGPFRGHQGEVSSVAFSSDGQRIVSGGSDRTVRLWDLNGDPIGNPFREHGSSVLSIAFDSTGNRIVSGGQDGTVRLSNLRGNPLGTPFRGHGNSVLSVGFSADNQRIISSSVDGTVRLWDANISAPLEGHESFVTDVVFSPDGQHIVSGSYDGTVRLWDLQGNPIGQPFEAHEGEVFGVAFSPDSQHIASASVDGTVRLWDLQGNPIGQPFEAHEGGVIDVAFSPDGQRIASASVDGTVRLWDLSGQQLEEIELPLLEDPARRQIVHSVTFSPDGQRIASASEDGVVRLWNLQGNPIGQPFEAHEGEVFGVAFSPNGQRIASASVDRTVRLWNLQGNPIGQPFRGHEDSVRDVAFSPDGQRIASASADRTVRLWDLQGNPIGQPFRGHEGPVFGVAFSPPDGQRIASASVDGTVRLWSVSSVDRFASACERLRYHPILLNPNDSFDPEVVQYVRNACDQRVWNQPRALSTWSPTSWWEQTVGLLVRFRDE